MRSKLRTLFVGIAAASVASFGLAVSSTSAQAAGAYPYNCTKIVTTSGQGQAHCWSGSEWYHVGMDCQNWAGGWIYEVNGNWVYPGQGTSSVGCPWYAHPYSSSGNGNVYPWISVN